MTGRPAWLSQGRMSLVWSMFDGGTFPHQPPISRVAKERPNGTRFGRGTIDVFIIIIIRGRPDIPTAEAGGFTAGAVKLNNLLRDLAQTLQTGMARSSRVASLGRRASSRWRRSAASACLGNRNTSSSATSRARLSMPTPSGANDAPRNSGATRRISNSKKSMSITLAGPRSRPIRSSDDSDPRETRPRNRNQRPRGRTNSRPVDAQDHERIWEKAIDPRKTRKTRKKEKSFRDCENQTESRKADRFWWMVIPDFVDECISEWFFLVSCLSWINRFSLQSPSGCVPLIRGDQGSLSAVSCFAAASAAIPTPQLLLELEPLGL